MNPAVFPSARDGERGDESDFTERLVVRYAVAAMAAMAAVGSAVSGTVGDLWETVGNCGRMVRGAGLGWAWRVGWLRRYGSAGIPEDPLERLLRGTLKGPLTPPMYKAMSWRMKAMLRASNCEASNCGIGNVKRVVTMAHSLCKWAEYRWQGPQTTQLYPVPCLFRWTHSRTHHFAVAQPRADQGHYGQPTLR